MTAPILDGLIDRALGAVLGSACALSISPSTIGAVIDRPPMP